MRIIKLFRKINLLVILFMLALLSNYQIRMIRYLIIFLLLAACIYQISKVRSHENIKCNKISILIWIIVSIALVVEAMVTNNSIKIIIFSFVPLMLTSLFTYLKVLLSGEKFEIQLLNQITILLNIFSFLNLYQVIFHRPIFFSYLQENFQEVQSTFIGTFAYRTSSAFGHPIVCGLFFVIAFICNSVMLKRGIFKTSLQTLLVINIFSTQSRSSWIALAVDIAIILFWRIRNIANVRFWKKHLLGTYLSLCLFITIIGFVLVNSSIIFSSIIDRFGSSLNISNSYDVSNLQRVGTINMVIDNFKNDPLVLKLFGHGILSAPNYMRTHQVIIQNFIAMDNQYLNWLYEFGIVGIILIAGWVLSLCFFIRNKPKNLKMLYILVILSIMIELFFFEGIGMGWTDVQIILGFIIGTLSVHSQRKSNRKQLYNSHSSISPFRQITNYTL